VITLHAFVVNPLAYTVLEMMLKLSMDFSKFEACDLQIQNLQSGTSLIHLSFGYKLHFNVFFHLVHTVTIFQGRHIVPMSVHDSSPESLNHISVTCGMEGLH
jgi:hypothetical protein